MRQSFEPEDAKTNRELLRQCGFLKDFETVMVFLDRNGKVDEIYLITINFKGEF